MFVDVVDDLVGNVVTDTLTPLAEQANLGGRDIVLDELGDDANVVSPLLQLNKGIVCFKSVVVEDVYVHSTYRYRCHCARE